MKVDRLLFFFSIFFIFFLLTSCQCDSNSDSDDATDNQTGDDDQTPDDDDQNEDDDGTLDDDDFDPDFSPRDYIPDDFWDILYPNGEGHRDFNDCEDLLEVMKLISRFEMIELLFEFGNWDGTYNDDDDMVSVKSDPPENPSSTTKAKNATDTIDRVFADSTNLYIANGGHFLIYDTSDPEAPALLSDTEINEENEGLIVDGDVAFQLSYSSLASLPLDIWPGVNRSDLFEIIQIVTMFDIADKQNPMIIRRLYLEGDLISAKSVDGKLMILVESNKKPTMNTDIFRESFDIFGDYVKALKIIIESNIEILDNAELSDWAARYYDIQITEKGEVASDGLISECNDFILPYYLNGVYESSIVVIDPASPLEIKPSPTVIATSRNFKVSESAVYIWGNLLGYGRKIWPHPDDEQLHKLDRISKSDNLEYSAGGLLDGKVDWSENIDEYQEYLRVASSVYWDAMSGSSAVITVYEQNDDILLRTSYNATSWHIGQTAAYSDHLAYYTNPLFCIDFSDITSPIQIGDSSVHGQSNQLTFFDDSMTNLISIETERYSSPDNLYLSTYDVTDPSSIFESDSLLVGTVQDAETMYPYDCCPFDETRGLIVAPWIESGGTYFSGFVGYTSTTAGALSEAVQIDHGDFTGIINSTQYSRKSTPLKALFVGQYLYTISDLGFVVTDMSDMTESFSQDLPWY